MALRAEQKSKGVEAVGVRFFAAKPARRSVAEVRSCQDIWPLLESFRAPGTRLPPIRPERRQTSSRLRRAKRPIRSLWTPERSGWSILEPADTQELLSAMRPKDAIKDLEALLVFVQSEDENRNPRQLRPRFFGDRSPRQRR